MNPVLRLTLATLALVAACLSAVAGDLDREAVATYFPPPLQVGEKLTDIAAWPITSELRPDGEPMGYVFESIDLAPIPGFEGTPINLLVAVDAKGSFLDVALLRQHEPVFLGGLGEEPLKAFLTQYQGISLSSPITVSSRYGGTGRTRDGRRVVLDGVTKATASIRIINQTVLTSALAVARARLGFAGGADLGPPATVRADLYEPLDFQALVKSGAVGHLRLTNAEVEALYADSDVAGDDPEARSDPDGTFIELWVAYLNVPSIGRTLLGDEGYDKLKWRLDAGQHALWIATAGRETLIDGSFVRGTSPQKLTLSQGGTPFELRDLDLDLRQPPGLPEFNSQLNVALPPISGLDPGGEMRFEFSLVRKKGFILPEFIYRNATIDYRAPERWFDRPPPPPPEWLQAWQARQTELMTIVAALLLLFTVLARPRWIVEDARRLKAFRLGFLAFTLGYIGWYAQGQLSIVQVTGAIKSLNAGAGLGSFLYDPVSLLMIAATAVTFFIWGRGTFCGWLCPFGALQEFSALLMRWLGVRPRRLPAGLGRVLSRARYGLLALLVALAALAPQLAERLVEVEPFKTSITVAFDRSWPFVAYAVLLLALAGIYYKFFCRYLCPLGAMMALGGKLRLLAWLPRRQECGKPCQRCRHDCAYDAIHVSGAIDYDDCFQCLDCVGIYHDADRCAPVMLYRRKGRQLQPAPVPASQPACATSGR
ncbi:MAG: 4Fe-4S binding protein [Rhodocyclaceae bacterium]|nr:4Fe-4S binding protein [Rhodocyclaceae bacterium]